MPRRIKLTWHTTITKTLVSASTRAVINRPIPMLCRGQSLAFWSLGAQQMAIWAKFHEIFTPECLQNIGGQSEVTFRMVVNTVTHNNDMDCLTPLLSK
jgi:hypothetical protein